MPTHYQGTAAEVRALDAYIKLARAADTISSLAFARTGLADAGLTPGQFGVLEALHHLGPLHQCDLARKHLQSGGNMTMIVDNLEKRGLVRRERSAADRRFVRVHLSPMGRRLIKSVFARYASVLTELMRVLSSAEQAQLGRLCRKLGTAHRSVESDPKTAAN
jgi:MarR family transcriptional regulator, 2-MHQ and catechol-resistance regulon repressor